MSRRHVVVHVLGRLDVGGAERMLLQITRRLADDPSGGRHVVVALSGLRGRLSEQFKQVGVEEVLCSLRPAHTFPVRLGRALRRLKADVVISHVSLASGLVLSVAALTGTRRRVAVMHSDGDGKPPSRVRRLYRRLARLLLRLSATDVAGVTESTLAFAGPAFRKSRGRVVPNAVDLDHFSLCDRLTARAALGLESGDRVVLHIGRGSPEKNRGALGPIVLEVGPSARLVVAGAETLEDLRIGPSDPMSRRTINAGLVDDVRPLLAAADVLLLPSIREGLPLVVLEALACGVPVVATDLPGIRHVCCDLPDVRLVPAGAPASAYATAVRDAFGQGRTREQVRASIAGSPYELDVVAEEWRRMCQART